MKWREVSEQDVQAVLTNPEKIEESVRGRKRARATLNRRTLDVVFKEEEARIVVITVIDKTR